MICARAGTKSAVKVLALWGGLGSVPLLRNKKNQRRGGGWVRADITYLLLIFVEGVGGVKIGGGMSERKKGMAGGDSWPELLTDARRGIRERQKGRRRGREKREGKERKRKEGNGERKGEEEEDTKIKELTSLL